MEEDKPCSSKQVPIENTDYVITKVLTQEQIPVDDDLKASIGSFTQSLYAVIPELTTAQKNQITIIHGKLLAAEKKRTQEKLGQSKQDIDELDSMCKKLNQQCLDEKKATKDMKKEKHKCEELYNVIFDMIKGLISTNNSEIVEITRLPDTDENASEEFLPSVCRTCNKPSFERDDNCSASCGLDNWFFMLQKKEIAFCKRKFYIYQFLSLLVLNWKLQHKLKFDPIKCTSFLNGCRRLGLLELIFDCPDIPENGNLDNILENGLAKLERGGDSIGVMCYDSRDSNGDSYAHCVTMLSHKHDKVKMMIYDAQKDMLFPISDKHFKNSHRIQVLKLIQTDTVIDKWLGECGIDTCLSLDLVNLLSNTVPDM